MAVTVTSPDDFLSKVGEEFGTSDWVEVTQDDIDRFAEVTGDRQWIHVDPEKAKEGPFGGTVAHGYFTLALAPMLTRQVVNIEGAKMGVNYGLNKVRFPNAMRVGKRVRAKVTLAEAKPIEPNGVRVVNELTFEAEGEKKPVCVAQTISLFYF